MLQLYNGVTEYLPEPPSRLLRRKFFKLLGELFSEKSDMVFMAAMRSPVILVFRMS